MNLSMSKISI